MLGSCLCGAVAFEISGEIPGLYQCHCSLCRKQSGSASNAATIVEVAQLTWLRGAESIRSWVKDTGFRSDFCAICGAPVPNLLRDKLYYWVPAGLLDTTNGSRVECHLHVASKAEWESGLLVGEVYDEMPSLGQLLKSLKRRTDA